MSANKLKPAQVRSKQVVVLMNAREHAMLTRKAHAAHVSAAQYIREACGLSGPRTGAKGGSPEPNVQPSDEQAQSIAGETAATPAREFVLVGSASAGATYETINNAEQASAEVQA